jgi:hypothetical protein
MQMRGGVVAARVLAVAGALFWGILWFGLIDLLVVVLQDERFHEDYLFESGWGLLYLLLVTVPWSCWPSGPARRWRSRSSPW